jgi:hypothetical protein
MKDVDRVGYVQPLAQPAGDRGSRVQVEASPFVLLDNDRRWISGQIRMLRNVRDCATVRPVEPQLAVGSSLDDVTLLVNGAMMPSTEHHEVRERRGPSVRPVLNVVALNEPPDTTREPTATISVLQSPA